MAQTRFYKGNSSYNSDILYTWDGKSLYKGNSSYNSDILYTFDGKHVYRGRSSYSSDILYTWDGIASTGAAHRTTAISSITWTVPFRCRY